MREKTKTIGTIGELEVAKHLIQNGYSVFQEIGDDSRIDLIAVSGRKMIRVQVKTVSSSTKGSVGIPRCKTTNHQKLFYTRDDVDVIALYVLDRNVILFASIDELGTGSCQGLTVRFEPSRNGQESKNANDYLSFERASRL